MKINLRITLDIESLSDLPDPAPGSVLSKEMVDAAREAVTNALRAACDNGFDHALSDTHCLSDIKVAEADGSLLTSAAGKLDELAEDIEDMFPARAAKARGIAKLLRKGSK